MGRAHGDQAWAVHNLGRDRTAQPSHRPQGHRLLSGPTAAAQEPRPGFTELCTAVSRCFLGAMSASEAHPAFLFTRDGGQRKQVWKLQVPRGHVWGSVSRRLGAGSPGAGMGNSTTLTRRETGGDRDKTRG